MQYLLDQKEFEEYQRMKQAGSPDVLGKFAQLRQTMGKVAIEVQRRYGHMDLCNGDMTRRVFDPIVKELNELQDLLTKL